MVIDRPGSQYIFMYSRESLNNSSDRASYIAYKDKRLTNKEYLEHWGKWVHLDDKENIHELAHKLDQYVEEGIIPCIKFDRAPQQWADMDQCVLCVYCDDRQRDEVWKILSDVGVKIKAWTYDREVVEKWRPGGQYLERWIGANKLTEEEADRTREESRQKFKATFFDKPDEPCRGWIQ